MTEHTLIVLVQDHPGVLHRTVSLLRRRAYNIASLSVGHSEIPGISRMTLVVNATEATQVVKQLDRLVEVLAVHDVTDGPAIQRETLMLKLTPPSDQLGGYAAIAMERGARVLYLDAEELIVELTDAPEQVDALIDALRPAGIAEMMRTGRLAMLRGPMRRIPDTPFRAQADGATEEEEAA